MRPLILLLALFACRDDDANPADDTGNADSGLGADTGAVDDTDDPEDTDPPDTDPPEPAYVVRFVAMGDGGTGKEGQYAVADQVEQICDRTDRGCDFVLYLGDNIYNSGVDGVDDEQFETKFEAPYANLDLPFFVALGNHDYGLEGAGLEWWKADHQVAYSDHSAKWNMPDNYYQVPPVEIGTNEVAIWALDTNAILFDQADDQQAWLDTQLSGSLATWKLVFGHHPYVSNGQHGDAGEYEGIKDWVPGASIPRGDHVKDFFDESVCGRADVYFAGHDHNRQWVGEACGTEHVVSGAAAKLTDFRNDANATLFQDDQTEGFLWVEIVEDTLTAYFYDRHGNEDGPFVITK